MNYENLQNELLEKFVTHTRKRLSVWSQSNGESFVEQRIELRFG
jgi:hypothetical protein